MGWSLRLSICVPPIFSRQFLLLATEVKVFYRWNKFGLRWSACLRDQFCLWLYPVAVRAKCEKYRLSDIIYESPKYSWICFMKENKSGLILFILSASKVSNASLTLLGSELKRYKAYFEIFSRGFIVTMFAPFASCRCISCDKKEMLWKKPTSQLTSAALLSICLGMPAIQAACNAWLFVQIPLFAS